MNLDFLPERFSHALKNLDLSNVYEIRMRKGFPIILKCINGNRYLWECGQTLFKENAFICSESDIDFVIDSVTERSLYAFNEEIKNGYLTAKNGIRIGLCGDCVFDEEKAVTMKNFSSLNIRIPNDLKGCADIIYNRIFSDGIKNTLIIAPPSMGKTTVLKDLARRINSERDLSIFIIDERGEFGEVCGENIDKTAFADKLFSFNYGLRSLSPDLIITDELCGEKDFECVKSAVNCGVKIIASIHAADIKDLNKKSFFEKGIFERYALIKGRDENSEDLFYDEGLRLI